MEIKKRQETRVEPGSCVIEAFGEGPEQKNLRLQNRRHRKRYLGRFYRNGNAASLLQGRALDSLRNNRQQGVGNRWLIVSTDLIGYLNLAWMI